MLKRVLSPGRQSKEQSSSAAEEGLPLEQQAPHRVVAAPVAAAEVAAGRPEQPPQPPMGFSPFDAPAEPAAKPMPPGSGAGLVQSMSGPPALGQPSTTALKSYLFREEVCPEKAPEMQQRLSQSLARVTLQPDVVKTAKATLRREAAEVHSLPKVSSEDLLPCLESVLSFPREQGAPCVPGVEAEARQGLAEVGIAPQQADAVERAERAAGGAGSPVHRASV